MHSRAVMERSRISRFGIGDASDGGESDPPARRYFLKKTAIVITGSSAGFVRFYDGNEQVRECWLVMVVVW